MKSKISEDNLININKEWAAVLQKEFEKEYFKKIIDQLNVEKKSHVIFPPEPLIFAAFDHTPFSKVRVVIIGQDPYHGEDQANGLCFSVNKGVRVPPSLQNIFKEMESDLGAKIPTHGDLTKWADQGVFMLNATLTVRAGQAGTHQKIGWETFTDAVIKTISDQKKGIVFLLWGKFAQTKAGLIDPKKHFILSAAHPSPLARGAFFGCKHFSKTNEILKQNNSSPINWETK